MNTTRRKLTLGSLLITPGALASINPEDGTEALRRHQACDWGECSKGDWQENDFAVDKELRILSVYRDREGTKFWIITEADRSATTILLPEEY